MQIKTVISALLVIFFAILLYGNDRVITVSPYANGGITIPYEISNLRNTDPNVWYIDTISFSSGTKITIMELSQMITGGYLRMGGVVFIDTISSVYYKFNDSLEKEYENWNSSDFRQGMYTNTINNPDVNWNEAMLFPDTLAPCDTFVYGIWADTDTLDTLIFVKSRHIYTTWYNLTDHLTYTSAIEDYKGILYVKDLNDTHLKIQIYKFRTRESPMGEFPDLITMLWAADSCGNGIFKHDPTSITSSDQILKRTDNIYLSSQNGVPCLRITNKLDIGKGSKIEIYNPAGRKIFQKHITSLEPIDLSHLHSGIYLAHISTGRGKFAYNFVLTD